MSIVYSNTLKNNRLNVMNDAVNGKTYAAGTGAGTQGNLVIGTSALSGATGVLATIPLPNPAFSIASQVATLLGVPLSATASATGTAAKAEIRDNAGTVIVGGLTVGVSASDINLNSVSISAGQTVSITSGTITHG